MALLSAPGNPQLLQLLGSAQFFNGDEANQRQSAFSKVRSVSRSFFTKIATNAFATASVKLSPTDPAQSLLYAKRAVALTPDANSSFSLGVAQIANKQYTDAIATLKPVHDKVPDEKTKLAVDRQLLSAAISPRTTLRARTGRRRGDEAKLDPNGNSAAVAMGSYYVTQGNVWRSIPRTLIPACV